MAKWLFAFLTFALVFTATPSFAKSAKPMTNRDVINLVHAKISQDSILLAIEGSKTAFDTSATALIELNKEGVPDAVIQAMMRADAPKPAAGSASTSSSVASKATNTAYGAFNPEEVILLDGSKRIAMHYLTPQLRTASRGLGFGGIGQYAVLLGSTATLHLTNNQPSFLLAVPSNAQPQSYFTLATFAVRKNGTREVSIGGGYMSYSGGIPQDRRVEVTCEQYANQAGVRAGFTVYKVTPATPLKSGEYAIVIHSATVRSVGFFGTGQADSYFDFSVGS